VVFGGEGFAGLTETSLCRDLRVPVGIRVRACHMPRYARGYVNGRTIAGQDGICGKAGRMALRMAARWSAAGVVLAAVLEVED
jgi:hypothetical protein